ncbi:prolipoprotein diacylglyceryl transferase family protein [Blastococcus sp. CT_GayMR16]|uniref:prolipoprotein diacylglyceryl transferase n=1 Tax=Blastococcus sp. CT_GayMR16 TaxID=2559607 RepID=UPI0010742AA6|nr:prolipoprotein diacylglyceryl transferase family protein [Blastococcus sp. CT_GayMR16]TFV91134.1 diacylglyceryl transferase [Blastococcus sp. CT_GayMR16]
MGLTYWFDAAPSGDPYSVAVRFTGRRLPATEPGPADSFQITQTLDRVIPGSGRIALTARVPKIAPGEWRVTATPVRDQSDPGAAAGSPHGPELLPTATATGTTMYLPAVGVCAPGVRMGAWPTLVGLGALVAFVVQGLLAGQRGLPTGRVLLVSVIAALVGVVGAKMYYLATHRQEKAPVLRAGMSVQGFVLAALTTLVLAAWWSNIPLAPMLDASAPGLLFGMSIGRLGCLLGGCCAGRPTASRWGVWSSDRRVGVRRIPVQLMESSMAGAVATATLIAAATVNPTVDGLLLVAGLAAYILGRQLLFPLRGLPRLTSWGRRTTLTLSALVLVVSLAILVDAPL